MGVEPSTLRMDMRHAYQLSHRGRQCVIRYRRLYAVYRVPFRYNYTVFHHTTAPQQQQTKQSTIKAKFNSTGINQRNVTQVKQTDAKML